MKTYHWLCSLLLLVCLSGCMQDPYKAVCQINMNDGTQGSGSLIAVSGDQALVLSCRHVAQFEGHRGHMTWPNGQETECVAVYVMPLKDPRNSYGSDLAIYRTRRPYGISPVPLAKFDPDDGPFNFVGYRGGQFYESTSHNAWEYQDVIRTDKPLVGGMSGGPGFNRFGQQVGIGVGSNRVDYTAATDGDALGYVISQLSE